MRGILPAVLILATAGCTAGATSQSDRDARAQREFAKATEGYVAGKPQTCIDASRISGPQVVRPDTLIYNEVGRLWVVQVEGCPFLNDIDPIIVAELQGNQMCRNDLFRTVQRGGGIPSGYCRFGDFTPWRKPR